MANPAAEAWHTIVPEKGNPHGPLPLLLVLLTVVTGLVDAFSYLELGRVFVANMTGNVVFLSFALGGADGFIWWASALGILTFVVGAFAGGRVAAARGAHRGRHLLAAAALQATLVLASLAVTLFVPAPYGTGALIVLIVLLGVAMGLQNATARGLGVPDLTTTVLTLTITGISADSHAAGGTGSKLGRRLVSIASMFLGGLVGTALILAGASWATLAIAFVLLAVVIVAAATTLRSTDAWTAKK
ncbi:YoaK family protein [Amycolatopsis japonica]|uniref:YoaK family protein n=1 Tax=Amycolatopsis japonica TaxID=208439 RepID=UPI00366C4B04